jgi:hypothetical protein
VSVLADRPDYRGQRIVDCALGLARDGYLDARIVGQAALAGRCDEQTLKRVWHYVARFGEPVSP